jgi:hypothetical protein
MTSTVLAGWPRFVLDGYQCATPPKASAGMFSRHRDAPARLDFESAMARTQSGHTRNTVDRCHPNANQV